MKNLTIMKCSKCGMEHQQTDSNCCWIHCSCGAEICGMCGSTNLGNLIADGLIKEDDETGFWCCTYCKDCKLEGCGMCVQEAIE